MKTIIYSIALLMTMTCEAFSQATPRTVDYSASSITFKIKNAGLNVEGTFKEYSAVVSWDPKNLAASQVEGKIKTKSISTGINGRDNHLRKEEFFHADKYPEIHFKSTAIKSQGAGYVVVGKLTIKGVTKEVSIPVSVTKTTTAEVYEGTLTINRLDFHVGEDSWVMSDDVMIAIKITTK